MKSKYRGPLGLWLGTLLLGSAALTQAAPPTAKVAEQSTKVARLFRDIRDDAALVRSAAIHLDALTESPNATWLDYDRQWNQIKPSVEDMQMKLARLETMQAAISPAERKELDQSKLMIEEIQGRTHQLRILLDKPGVQTNDAKFKVYGRGLRNEAGQLERTAAAS